MASAERRPGLGPLPSRPDKALSESSSLLPSQSTGKYLLRACSTDNSVTLSSCSELLDAQSIESIPSRLPPAKTSTESLPAESASIIRPASFPPCLVASSSLLVSSSDSGTRATVWQVATTLALATAVVQGTAPSAFLLSDHFFVFFNFLLLPFGCFFFFFCFL